MEFRIISPQMEEAYVVAYVEAQTAAGFIVIKPGHAPMLATLVSDSELTFLLASGEYKNIYLKRPGFLDVDRQSVTALLNQEIGE